MDSGADQASDDGLGDAPIGVIEDPAGRWRVTLGARALDAGALGASVVLPSCGAVVTFTGTTRDHAPDPAGGLRTGIGRLDYEAYETEALARMAKVALAKKDSGDPFYAAKLHTARFYFAKLLPETAGLIRTARSGVAPLLAMDEAMF